MPGDRAGAKHFWLVRKTGGFRNEYVLTLSESAFGGASVSDTSVIGQFVTQRHMALELEIVEAKSSDETFALDESDLEVLDVRFRIG